MSSAVETIKAVGASRVQHSGMRDYCVRMQVHLDKQLKLLDSPGIVFSAGATPAASALRNCIKVTLWQAHGVLHSNCNGSSLGLNVSWPYLPRSLVRFILLHLRCCEHHSCTHLCMICWLARNLRSFCSSEIQFCECQVNFCLHTPGIWPDYSSHAPCRPG